MTAYRPGAPLTPYQMRRREAIRRAAVRLDATANEVDAARAELVAAQQIYRDRLMGYTAEYRRYARLVREARKAGVPSTAVARWSGFNQATVYRIMHTSRLPSVKHAFNVLLHHTRPPAD